MEAGLYQFSTSVQCSSFLPNIPFPSKHEDEASGKQRIIPSLSCHAIYIVNQCPNQLCEEYFFIKVGLNCSLKHHYRGTWWYLVVFSITIAFPSELYAKSMSPSLLPLYLEWVIFQTFVPQVNIYFKPNHTLIPA